MNFQLDDLDYVKGSRALASDRLISPSIAEDGTVDIMSEFEDGQLTYDQQRLLSEIASEFSTQDNAADLGILYEITGF